MRLWFFDSLDGLAGHAFVSLREADLEDVNLDMEAPSAFISPPNFRVEPIASRATALAAARGSFQLGLFLGESEIGFPTAEDAAEFVRRLYIGGGGGDGDAGIGPVPPPPAPDRPTIGGEGPDFEPPSFQPVESMGLILRAYKAACDSAKISFDKIDRFDGRNRTIRFQRLTPSPVSYAHHPFSGSADDILGVAAWVLLAELLGRCPNIKDHSGLALWWQALSRLVRAIDRLDQWKGLVDGSNRQIIAAAGEFLIRNRTDLFPTDVAYDIQNDLTPPDRGLAAAFWLISDFGFGRFYFPRPFWQYIDRYRYRWPAYLGADYLSVGDPFEDLARWPIPATLRNELRPHAQQMSLADLVCLLSADPALIDDKGLASPLLIFAAVHLQNDAGFGPRAHTSDLLQKAWLTRTVDQAVQWLFNQMPSKAFPPEIEALFKESAEKRYGK